MPKCIYAMERRAKAQQAARTLPIKFPQIDFPGIDIDKVHRLQHFWPMPALEDALWRQRG
jgi:hypothetical protein